MTFRTILVFLVLQFCLSGCDSNFSSPDQTGLNDGVNVDYSEKYSDLGFTYDAKMNDVSLKFPGFKGIMASEDGSQVKVITDSKLSQSRTSNDLINEISDIFGFGTDDLVLYETENVDARTSGVPRPDFHTLYKYKLALRRLLFESDLVDSIDLDEVEGNITIGTYDSKNIDLIKDELTDEENKYVKFSIISPIKPYYKKELSSVSDYTFESTASGRSLRFTRFNPLVGGAEIHFKPSNQNSEYVCTQGPSVQHNDGRFGFLTNSHCTGAENDAEKYRRIYSMKYYQPFSGASGGDYLGFEALEQPFRSGWSVTDGFYADVAFIQTVPGVTVQGQMTSANDCTIQSPDCVENGAVTNFDVYPWNDVAALTRVYKTGRTTGTTAGFVSHTCVDYRVTSYAKMLCQNRVRYSIIIPSPPVIADFGDSGSPVLDGYGPTASPTKFVGILWGGTVGESDFYYSPWGNIGQWARAGTKYGLPIRIMNAAEGPRSN